MAAGDRSKVWFDELKDMLREKWHDKITIEELLELTEQLNVVLKQIRDERKIEPVMMWCPKCQKREKSKPSYTTVRGAILAAGRFAITSDDRVKALEKEWKSYMRRSNIDGYGKPKVKKPKLKLIDSCDDRS